MARHETRGITANDAVAFLIEVAALVALSVWGFRTGSSLGARLLLGLGTPALGIALWALFAAPRSVFDSLPAEITVKVLVLGGAVLATFTLVPLGLALAFAAVTAVNAVLLYVGPSAR